MHNHDQHSHVHDHSPSTVFEVALKNKKNLAESSMAFIFEKPEGFGFKAGQHAEWSLINPTETDAEGNSRMFSLASSPAEPTLQIATRMRDTAFKRVLGKMEIGDRLTVANPHGSFTLHNDSSKPAVFLIGGIGITPVLSIIKDATERKLPHNIFLFYSNKRLEDTAFLDELRNLAKQNPNFKLIATMTEMRKSESDWQGETGYIDNTMLKRHLENLQSAIYYLSGPPGMVEAMRKLLTDSLVNEDNIRTEEFSGY